MDGPTRTFEEAPPISYIRRAPFMPRWWRRRNYLKVAVACLVLFIFSSGGYVFAERNATTKVTVGEAVGRFRSDAHGSSTARTITSGVGGPAGQGVAGSRAPASSAPSVARQPSHAPAAAPAPYVLPPPGVYTYRTTGGEQISIAGAHHDYPAETTATVTHLDGCHWRIENDVIKEHTDIRTFCGRTSDLFQDEQARWVTFYGKREGENITFAPPQLMNDVSERAGARTSADGSDPDGDGVTVERTYIGRVPIAIGDETISAVRIRMDGTMTGSSQGTSVDDLWLDPITGMTLRWDRFVDAVSNKFGANVRYTERASFVLESPVPRT
jgi:hypothetical protein